jgi:hypothetical protein
VKIRGNAHHVAEKYLQLARDAHTGGDPVAAENYLQHAEHYFRLIAAAQAAQALAQNGQPRGDGEADDLDDDEDFGGMSDRFASPSERAQPGLSPPPQSFAPPALPQSVQPSVPERPPYDGDRQGQSDRNGYQNRQDRQNNRFQDRGPRPDRPYGDRPDGPRDNRNRDGRPRDFRPYRDPQQPPRDAAVTDQPVSPTSLPSFITAAPRTNGPLEAYDATNAQTVETVAAQPEPAADSSETQQETRYPGRGRRRRLRSPYGFNVAGSDEGALPTPTVGDEQPSED